MIRLLAAGVAVLALTTGAAEPDGAAPYAVAPGLFQPERPDLGLKPAPGAQTFTVFAPTEETDRFSNGVVLIPFKGRLYAQWQSSARDEDSADTWVAYSVSDDGQTWSVPMSLAPAGEGGVMRSSGAGGRTARPWSPTPTSGPKASSPGLAATQNTAPAGTAGPGARRVA
jgi:hypothetical protein